MKKKKNFIHRTWVRPRERGLEVVLVMWELGSQLFKFPGANTSSRITKRQEEI